MSSQQHKKVKILLSPTLPPPYFGRHSLKLLSPTLQTVMNWILLSPPPLSSDPDNSPKFGTCTCTDYALANVGVDHAGPLFVKNIYGTSTEMHKAYILLLTCSTSRAIHLELVSDVSGPATVRGLHRFIGRKRTPHFIVSDNYKSFESLELRQFLWSKSVDWDFILLASPWWSGFMSDWCVLLKTLCERFSETPV